MNLIHDIWLSLGQPSWVSILDTVVIFFYFIARLFIIFGIGAKAQDLNVKLELTNFEMISFDANNVDKISNKKTNIN